MNIKLFSNKGIVAGFFEKFAAFGRVLFLGFVFTAISVSCSDSDSVSILEDDASSAESPDTASSEDAEPLFQAYTETGPSGMRVTYSPASLTVMTNVEELEKVYLEVMECVGMTTSATPTMFLTTDKDIFPTRSDGTELFGYFDETDDRINVHSDDLDAALGNRFYWTRHGMIEYLMVEHGLEPDSNITPFLSCRFDN